MAALGDTMIGTVPPLNLVMCQDPEVQATIQRDGAAKFTVGSVEVATGGRQIEDEAER